MPNIKVFFDSLRFTSLFNLDTNCHYKKSVQLFKPIIYKYMYRQCSSKSPCAATRKFPYPKKSETERPQRCWSLGSVLGRLLQQPQARVIRPGMGRWAINCRFLYFCRRIMCAVQSVFQVNRISCIGTVSSVGSQKAVDCLLYRTTNIQHV